MRRAAWLILATGCAEIIDVPDQILGYEDLSIRMCGCDFFRVQSDVTEGRSTGDLRCEDALASNLPNQDELVLTAVEAGCTQCDKERSWAAECYALVGGKPNGAACSTALDCASFACGIAGYEVGSECQTGNFVCEKVQGECVNECAGCQSPTDVEMPICLGSVDVLLSAQCQVEIPAGSTDSEIYASFYAVAQDCDVAATVCETHPSRPVQP
jgi:hypothetical protein